MALLYDGLNDYEALSDATHIIVDPSITVIPPDTFKDCINLEEVSLPEGLEEIGENAFEGCRYLGRITIPSSCKIIHDEAFRFCINLSDVTLLEGLQEIGARSFRDCTLIKIKIPSTCVVIREEAFRQCIKLKEVELQGGLQEIGPGAFNGCPSLEKIDFPNTIRIVLSCAFLGCVKLEEVNLPEGLLEIGCRSFSSCKSLKLVTLPSTLKAIPDGCFEDCHELTELNLPCGLECIGQGAFSGTQIQNLSIPPSVTRIASSAFFYCNNMFSLELPKDLNQIDCNIMDGGSVLRSLRNVAFAFPQRCKGVENFFDVWETSDIGKVFQPTDKGSIAEALKHRFDGDVLAIHKLCYYQSHYPEERAMRLACDYTALPDWVIIDGDDDSGNHQDCLGMTPLHILACSTRQKQNLALYKVIVEKYPKNLTTEDKWGALPILYAFWSNAPSDVVQLFVDKLRAWFPDRVLDWERMLETLARANARLVCIKKLVQTQRTAFPDQKINWKEVVTRCANAPSVTFEILLKFSVSKRIHSLGVARWQRELGNYLDTTVKQYLVEKRMSDGCIPNWFCMSI